MDWEKNQLNPWHERWAPTVASWTPYLNNGAAHKQVPGRTKVASACQTILWFLRRRPRKRLKIKQPNRTTRADVFTAAALPLLLPVCPEPPVTVSLSWWMWTLLAQSGWQTHRQVDGAPGTHNEGNGNVATQKGFGGSRRAAVEGKLDLLKSTFGI